MSMKTTILAAIMFTTVGVYADDTISASLADSAWDGKKIPAGQQCNKFGGEGASPLMTIKKIPAGANAIVMEYSDRSYQAMDLGGHGKFAYRIKANTTAVDIPSMPGHTFDLPENFFLIEAQRAPSWDKAGNYLPPCSGGKGNQYYVTIKAVKEVNGGIQEVLGKVELPLGQY